MYQNVSHSQVMHESTVYNRQC